MGNDDDSNLMQFHVQQKKKCRRPQLLFRIAFLLFLHYARRAHIARRDRLLSKPSGALVKIQLFCSIRFYMHI